MIDPRELAWAAGLWEGEGCFAIRRGCKPTAVLGMTDEDAVRRFHAAVGIGKVYGPRLASKLSKKSTWSWKVDTFEGVQAVVGFLWYGLGQRRRARATEVLRASTPDRRRREYRK